MYASQVKTPPSKAKVVSNDTEKDVEEDATVDEIEPEAEEKEVAPINVGEAEGDSEEDDDDEAPDDVGFSEAKSQALESIAAQKKTKLEEASRRKEKRRLQLERNIQQKEKKLKKSAKPETGGEEGDDLSLDFLEKLDEATKIARDPSLSAFDFKSFGFSLSNRS